MSKRAPLRWEQDAHYGWWIAYRCDLTVGSVVQVRDSGLFSYRVSAVNTRLSGAGTVKSLATAKRAVERAWNDWLEEYKLVDEAAKRTFE